MLLFYNDYLMALANNDNNLQIFGASVLGFKHRLFVFININCNFAPDYIYMNKVLEVYRLENGNCEN